MCATGRSRRLPSSSHTLQAGDGNAAMFDSREQLSLLILAVGKISRRWWELVQRIEAGARGLIDDKFVTSNDIAIGTTANDILVAAYNRAAYIATGGNTAIAARVHDTSHFTLFQPAAYFCCERLILGKQLLKLYSQRSLYVFVARRLRSLACGFECGWFSFDFRFQF